MAEEEKKSLEMRVAALEDKLSGMTVSDEEMAAASKVLGGGAGLSPQLCAISQCIVHQCIINQCIIQQCIIRSCIIQQCFECSCGPCNIGGGGLARGGGFGTLGT